MYLINPLIKSIKMNDKLFEDVENSEVSTKRIPKWRFKIALFTLIINKYPKIIIAITMLLITLISVVYYILNNLL